MADGLSTTYCRTEVCKMSLIKKMLSLFIIVSVMLLALPDIALAAPPGKVILGDTYTLKSGEVLDEDLLILGGNVRLEEGSRVNGDVVLMGGNLWVAGTISGNLAVIGGIALLQDSAVIMGDFSAMGAQVERHHNAEIQGETFTNQDIPFNIVPGTWQSMMRMPVGATPILDIGWIFLRVILWGLLAMLIVMFLPSQTERIAKAVTSQPWVAGGLGIATALVLPILLIVLILTICLIPISIIGFLVLIVAWAYGLVGLGLELGKRFGQVFKQEWHPALAAGVGTFLLTLVLNGLSAILPCLGWIPQLIAGALGLGGVLLTRFGMQDYPNEPIGVEAIETVPD